MAGILARARPGSGSVRSIAGFGEKPSGNGALCRAYAARPGPVGDESHAGGQRRDGLGGAGSGAAWRQCCPVTAVCRDSAGRNPAAREEMGGRGGADEASRGEDSRNAQSRCAEPGAVPTRIHCAHSSGDKRLGVGRIHRAGNDPARPRLRGRVLRARPGGRTPRRCRLGPPGVCHCRKALE